MKGLNESIVELFEFYLYLSPFRSYGDFKPSILALFLTLEIVIFWYFSMKNAITLKVLQVDTKFKKQQKL